MNDKNTLASDGKVEVDVDVKYNNYRVIIYLLILATLSHGACYADERLLIMRKSMQKVPKSRVTANS